MRRLLTSALSCVLAAALVGPAGAATHEGALSQPALLASASAASLDPNATIPQDAVDVAAGGLPLDTPVNVPVAATRVVIAKTTTAPAASALDAVGTDAVAVANVASGPSSPLSDLMMWGAPTSQTTPHAEVSLSAHAGRTIRAFTAGILDRTRSLVTKITESAMQYIGTPYSFGGTTAAGFDCSGYVQRVFAMVGISLPRTADAQYLVGQHVNVAQAKRGDLIFFQTYTAGVSHVGIYLGNDQFIHSSSSHGVTVSSLHDGYWAAHFVGIERIVGGDRVGMQNVSVHD